MMDEDRHADVVLRDSPAPSLEEGVRAIERSEHAPDRSKHPSFRVLVGIAEARSRIVAVELVGEAAAEALVEPGARELLGILDIRRAPEADLCEGVEPVALVEKPVEHRLPELVWNRGLVLVADEVANEGELAMEAHRIGRRKDHVRSEAARDLVAKRSIGSDGLVEERVPQVERDRARGSRHLRDRLEE